MKGKIRAFFKKHGFVILVTILAYTAWINLGWPILNVSVSYLG